MDFFSKKRHTLKRRISRAIYLCSIIITLLFTFIIVSIIAMSFKYFAVTGAHFFGVSTAKEISSKGFLVQMGINNLRQLDANSPQTKEWLKYSSEVLKLIPPELAEMDAKQHPNVNLAGKEKKPSVSKEKAVSVTLNHKQATIELEPEYLKKVDAVFMDITIYGKTIYSNRKVPDYYSKSSNLVKKLYNYFDMTESYPIKDAKGNIVGNVAATFNPSISLVSFFMVIPFVVIMFFVALIIAYIISRVFSVPIIIPITRLQKKIQEIAENGCCNISDAQIVLKKSPREIEEIAYHTNMIMNKMRQYNDTLEEQKYKLEEQNEELGAQNDELFNSRSALEAAKDKLVKVVNAEKNLLNNAGQGFLTFGSDLCIGEEYSLECLKIFGGEIAGIKISRVLFPDDVEQRTYMDNVVEKIFSEKDKLKKGVYLSLLPDRHKINGRDIQVEYKLIEDVEDKKREEIMTIITDITEKIYLESQMEMEKKILKMVVKVVSSYKDFAECTSAYKYFCQEKISEILASNKMPDDILYEIFREIHTYKGSFAQFEMITIVDKLHEMESDIAELRKNMASNSVGSFKSYLESCDMENWLDDDMQLLKETLGEEFFERENALVVDKEKLLEIEKKIMTILTPAECKLLLPDLNRLRYKPFKELLKAYPEHVSRLAERLEKAVNPLEIEGGEFAADVDRYQEFARSLIHVFRNSIDHGLETPDQRIVAGKEDYGNIKCSAELIDGKINLMISDDGCGLNIEKIREKAVEKGFYTSEDAGKLSEAEAMQLIFKDDISTKETVTEFSGRGVGLAAVKGEVEKLGGSVEVKTIIGIGTALYITIPNNDVDMLPDISERDAMNAFIQETKDYLQTNLGIVTASSKSVVKVKRLSLKRLSVFTNIRGIIGGKLIISLDERIAKAISASLAAGEFASDNDLANFDGNLNMLCNNVLVHALHKYPEVEQLLSIETPITINSEGASISHTASSIWSCDLETSEGAISMSFVATER